MQYFSNLINIFYKKNPYKLTIISYFIKLILQITKPIFKFKALIIK